jgi:hypothetical protein
MVNGARGLYVVVSASFTWRLDWVRLFAGTQAVCRGLPMFLNCIVHDYLFGC